MKEFVNAGNDEKKAAYTRLEEEVEKLKGPSARLSLLYICVYINIYFPSCKHTYIL